MKDKPIFFQPDEVLPNVFRNLLERQREQIKEHYWWMRVEMINNSLPVNHKVDAVIGKRIAQAEKEQLDLVDNALERLIKMEGLWYAQKEQKDKQQ